MNNRLYRIGTIIIISIFVCCVQVWAQKGAAFFTEKADAAFKKEKHAKAEKLYKKAIQVDEKHAAAYWGLAKTQEYYEEYPDALLNYEYAVNLDPKIQYFQDKATLNYYLALDGLQAGETCNCGTGKIYIPEVVATDSENYAYFSTAKKDLEAAFEIDAKNVEVVFQLALICQAMGEKELACEHLATAKDLGKEAATELIEKICEEQ